MYEWVYYILFALCTLVVAFSHILLKRSANRNYKGLKIFLNGETIVGYFIFFGITLAIVYLYRYIELSTAALLETLSYVFVPALSWFFFKEKLTRHQIVGIAFIISGIVVFVLFG